MHPLCIATSTNNADTVTFATSTQRFDCLNNFGNMFDFHIPRFKLERMLFLLENPTKILIPLSAFTTNYADFLENLGRMEFELRLLFGRIYVFLKFFFDFCFFFFACTDTEI